MVRIDGAYRLLEPLVEGTDRGALGIPRLVHRVVAGDPRIAAIVVGEVLPQVDDPILELPLRPEVRPLGRIVAVPMLVLSAGHRVQIQDRVDAVPGAGIHHAVEPADTLLPDLERRIVVLEVPVVERNPDRIYPEVTEEGRVPVGEEHREESVEEPLVALVAERPAQRAALLGLRPRIAGDEVLHVHPAAQTEAPQRHGIGSGHDPRPADGEDRRPCPALTLRHRHPHSGAQPA